MRCHRLAAALGVLALTACAQVPAGYTTPTPTAATPTPTATTPAAVTLHTASGKVTLKVRHVPASAGNDLAKIPTGSAIIVDCQVKGTTVSGTQGSTAVWDHLSYEGHTGYVSAAYVEGGAAASIPTCPYTAALVNAPLPLPTLPTPSPTEPVAQRRAAIVAIAESQLGAAEHAVNCNPYSKKCEEWSAHFAIWVWGKAGLTVPDYWFTGDLYAWAKRTGHAHTGVAGVGPGDLVFYGTGMSTSRTSTHVDIVVAAYPDHLHVIGGNVDDRVSERDVPRTGIYGWVSVSKG